MSFRTEITNYADDHWFTPCADNIVWVFNGRINVKEEIAKRRLSPDEWKAAFLIYDGLLAGKPYKLEGLYLLRATDFETLPQPDLNASRFTGVDSCSYPMMIASWYDRAENLIPQPPYFGLNDCAHFVTECLAAGGIQQKTTGVGDLMRRLRGMSDTKTLALTVDAQRARGIINAGILKPGDVIIYSQDQNTHEHSAVYLGAGKVATHTKSNHPDHPLQGGKWDTSANPDHPLVTLIHFGSDDFSSIASRWVHGWWEVTTDGKTYFYYFDPSGPVRWSSRRPNDTARPLSFGEAEGVGYWFDLGAELKIAWQKTGSCELYEKPDETPNQLTGLLNSQTDSMMTKL